MLSVVSHALLVTGYFVRALRVAIAVACKVWEVALVIRQVLLLKMSTVNTATHVRILFLENRLFFLSCLGRRRSVVVGLASSSRSRFLIATSWFAILQFRICRRSCLSWGRGLHRWLGGKAAIGCKRASTARRDLLSIRWRWMQSSHWTRSLLLVKRRSGNAPLIADRRPTFYSPLIFIKVGVSRVLFAVIIVVQTHIWIFIICARIAALSFAVSLGSYLVAVSIEVVSKLLNRWLLLDLHVIHLASLKVLVLFVRFILLFFDVFVGICRFVAVWALHLIGLSRWKVRSYWPTDRAALVLLLLRYPLFLALVLPLWVLLLGRRIRLWLLILRIETDVVRSASIILAIR